MVLLLIVATVMLIFHPAISEAISLLQAYLIAFVHFVAPLPSDYMTLSALPIWFL